MTELHPEIKNVLDRIVDRSEDTRKKYLKTVCCMVIKRIVLHCLIYFRTV